MTQSRYTSVRPGQLPTAQYHEYLLGTIGPRPIAWASTLDEEGIPNLAPFSFFNVFGSNPATIIFSPSRRVRDNTTKHTLANCKHSGEVVVNIVSYEQMGQMMLSSAEYPAGTDEIAAVGLRTIPSLEVQPPRIEGAPAQFECRVRQIIETGTEGGSGQLIICDVLVAHLREDVILESGKIDPRRVDSIARMGSIWYTRAREGLFEMPNPRGTGKITELPAFLLESEILTGSDLCRLASTQFRPEAQAVAEYREKEDFLTIMQGSENLQRSAHIAARELIHNNRLEDAWLLLSAAQVQLI